MGRAITLNNEIPNDRPDERLSVSLDVAKLTQLMVSGHLSGMDLHSADPAIKDLIRELCLKSCAQKTCQSCPHQNQCLAQNPLNLQVVSVQLKGLMSH